MTEIKSKNHKKKWTYWRSTSMPPRWLLKQPDGAGLNKIVQSTIQWNGLQENLEHKIVSQSLEVQQELQRLLAMLRAAKARLQQQQQEFSVRLSTRILSIELSELSTVKESEM